MLKELDPLVRKAIERKRLIFTVTTGRSGTTYLTYILKRVDGVAARHEAHSRYSVIMRYVQEDPSLARKFLIDTKLPEISRQPGRIYAETSHLFCKGFFEPLVDLGIVPDLILLSRDKRKVASSIFLLGDIPGNTMWYLSPDDPGVLPLPGWEDLNEYQRCFWYCLEIERRAKQYGARARELGARVVDIDLSELTTVDGQSRLLKEMDLPEIRRWLRFKMWLQRRVENTKEKDKERANRRGKLNELDLAGLEADVLGRVSTGT